MSLLFVDVSGAVVVIGGCLCCCRCFRSTCCDWDVSVVVDVSGAVVVIVGSLCCYRCFQEHLL